MKIRSIKLLYIFVAVAIISHRSLEATHAQKVFFPDLVLEDSRVDWYTKHLIALEEPSLFEASQGKKLHCYRFLWLRTFDPPIALRLVLDPEGTGLLFIKIANGAGGYEPGKLTTNESVPVTKQNVDNFLGKLSKIKYWNLPTHEIEAKDGSLTIGLDGAQWILEAVRGGQYHIVDRWSPDKGSYRETALFLVGLAQLKIKSIY